MLQKQLNQTIRRVDDLIVLHTSKIDKSAKVTDAVNAIGPIDPKKVSADTIASLEVLKELMVELEQQWIDKNGNFRKVTVAGLIFDATLRKLVFRTVDLLVTSINRIHEIFTDGK